MITLVPPHSKSASALPNTGDQRISAWPQYSCLRVTSRPSSGANCTSPADASVDWHAADPLAQPVNVSSRLSVSVPVNSPVVRDAEHVSTGVARLPVMIPAHWVSATLPVEAVKPGLGPGPGSQWKRAPDATMPVHVESE